tara:strand:- start:1438 stop:2163 length:726 start_codon:yes stop_codon:yes gene_type:complete
MTARLYEISDGTIPDEISDNEYKTQFRERILPEWRELKNERGHQDPHDIVDGTMPCICGHKLSAQYFKIFNTHNGNMAIIGSGCVKYIRKHDLQSLTPKEVKKIVKKKLEGALNYTGYKSYFDDMNEYTKNIVKIVSEEWSLVKTATYLKVYRENPNITAMLIDQMHTKAVDQIKGAKEADSLNYNQKQSLLQESDRLKKKNTELQNKIHKLESSIDQIEYENKQLTKLNVLNEHFFENTY